MTQPIPPDVREVAHENITTVLDNYRKRLNPLALAELTDSIRAHGVLQPICLRPRSDGDFDLVFGRRRLMANQSAGKTHIPAVIRVMSDEDVRVMQLVENGQREDAHPIEEAEAFKELQLQFNHSIEEVAARVGKSASHVRLRLKLCDLIEDARVAFFEEKLPTQVAYLLARLPNAEDQARALDTILKAHASGDPLTTAEVHHFIERNFMLQLTSAPFDTKDASLVPDAGACAACPKHTGNQRELFGDFQGKPLCIDAACYHLKTEASYTRRAEEALAKGHEVLSEEESLKHFPHGAFLMQGSPYVDLDSRSLMDPEGRTWRQLLRKQRVPVLLATDSYHGAHELVLRAEAESVLESAGYDFVATAKQQQAQTAQHAQDHHKQMAEAREKHTAMLEAIISASEQEPVDEEFWRILVAGLAQGSWHDTIADVVKRRGLHVKGTRPEEVLLKHLEKAPEAELRGIALELVIRRGAQALTPGAIFQRAAKRYQVDARKVAKRLAKQAERDARNVEEDSPTSAAA